VDVGIGRNQKSTKSKDAAKAVTKATSRNVNVGQNNKVWKMSEIQKLKPWEFEKYEAEIDQAMKSGQIINE
jgi:20S proteasome alpha/beta subunit